MRKFNIMSLLLAVVGVLTFASCQHEYADWTPGEKDNNLGVYFSNTDDFAVATTDKSVSIEVKRTVVDEAVQVSLRGEVVPKEFGNLFTIPESVSFAAGSDTSAIKIEFDGSALEFGVEYGIKLKLDAEQASSYAVSENTFYVMIPEPWTSIGKGIYFDDLLCGVFADTAAFLGLGTYVEFEQSDLDSNRIRVVNPFAPATLGSMWGAVPDWMYFTAGDANTYLEFDITDPANVKMSGVELMNDDGTVGAVAAPLYIQMDANSVMYDLHLLVPTSNPIVLQDGIISFPTSGVELAAFSEGQYAGYFYQANASGYLQYYLPGVEFANYGIMATYEGIYVSPDSSVVNAIFTFVLGADVASYKFAFVPGDVTEDASAVIDAIVAGSEDLTIYSFEADTTRCEVELTKGVYTLVAVPYSEEGEARTSDAYALNFYFNGAAEMPEVNVDVEVNTPAYYAEEDKKAEVEQQRPACFNVACKVEADASQLKAIKFWYGNAEALVEQEIDDETLFANYAGDASSMIANLAENGAALAYFNVTAETPNFVVKFRFYTIYGFVVDKTVEYELPKYDGTFPVGAYKFTEGDYEEVFTIAPAKSYTTFFWTNTTFDGSSWYCDLNEETNTLSMSGILFNYEDEGSQFGMLFGYYDQDRTLVYAYMSAESAEFDAMAPLKLSVVDGALSLETYYAAAIFDYTGASPAFTGNYHFLFTPEAAIEPYVEEEAETSAKVLSVSNDEVDFVGVKSELSERVEIVKPLAKASVGSMKPATLKR